MSPYRGWLVRCLVVCSCLSIIVGIADVAFALGGASLATAVRAALVASGLCAVVGALVGSLVGVAVGAAVGTAAPGPGRRLRDPDTDRVWTAALASGLLAVAAFAVVVVLVAPPLVGEVERKSTGAAVLALVLAVAAPLCGLYGLAAYRPIRALVARLPAGGRVPLFAVFSAAATATFALAGAVVFLSLDWRVLPVGAMAGVALYAVACAGLLFASRKVAIGPRLARGATLAVLAAALVGAIGSASLSPDQGELRILVVDSRITPYLVKAARSLSDRDGDGYSARFGGGDCDDGDARVFPGAADIPDNGIDENCRGGDAHRPERTEVATRTIENRAPPVTNLVFVIIDTLRADRLGALGYRRGGVSVTPTLDRLVEDGVLFSHAYAQAPNTPRSLPSIFFSLLPSHIRWHDANSNYPIIHDDNQGLFEALTAGGITTSGITSHFYFTDERGIWQGFARHSNAGAKSIADSNKDISWPRVVAAAEAELNELTTTDRFVLFVHFAEPHSAYVRHPEYPAAGTGFDAIETRYDYEIAAADAALGRLVDALTVRSLLDRTAIVVTSDHGEAFGEHRFAGRKMYFHGQTLYDELLRVPLIFRVPGTDPQRIDERVMLVDIAPTITDLVGVATPPSFAGRSLYAAMHGEPLPKAPVIAELLPTPSWKEAALAVIADDHKLIEWHSRGIVELFDLASDPGEKANLADGDRDRVEALRQVAESLLSAR